MKYYIVGGVLFVMVLYLVAFREQTLAYNYGGKTCDQRIVLLPGIFSQVGGENYTVTAQGGFNIAGEQIAATSLCISPTKAPAENSSETLAYAPWGGWLARLRYEVNTGAHPTVDASILKDPIPASRELLLPLSKPDTTFSYRLKVNDTEAPCKPVSGQLACDVPMLKLKQGSEYTARLERYFNNKSLGDVTSANLKTISPLSVTDSSIKNDTVVYDKPKSLVIAVDKPLLHAELAAWRIDGDAPIKLQITTNFDDKKATVTFAEDLPRQATIVLKVTKFEATDGSVPLDEQILSFKTSGGPRVTGINVGSYGVVPGTQIVVTFDQPLADQDLAPLIEANGATYQAKQGNQLIFSTSGAPLCAGVSIVLKPDIKSPYDISGQSAWQYNGRIRCYTVSTIGYSVNGRAINAYVFGSSGPSVMYAGAIHGDEVSTKTLMDRWIQELDANPSKIPAGKRVIVVPTINPDGLASGRRVNARNVDLNRNFATSDWKKDVENVYGGAFPGGGGETAMSEPETKAIAAFVASQRPELVVSYHSIGGMVISNQAGQATIRATQYARLSGYRLSGGGDGEFGYQITGTADDYYREILGISSILIELGSHSYHQFEQNQSAMRAMLD